MAAVTLGVTLEDNSDGTSYVTGAFTPAANDLLCVFVAATSTVAAGSVTDSQSGTYTKVASATYGSHTGYLFVRTALVPAGSSTTVTFDCTGDASGGVCITVLRVSGMSRTGSAAVRQSTPESDQASSTPNPAFAAAALTGNPTIGSVMLASATLGITEPTNWTEQADFGHINPANGMECVSRNSGFTGTVITWGSSVGITYADIIAELDTSTITTTVSKSDALALKDALRKSRKAFFAQSAILSDAVRKKRTLGNSDAGALSDALKLSRIVTRRLSDAMLMADAATTSIVSTGHQIQKTDSTILRDALVKALAKTKADAGLLSDAVRAVLIIPRSASDSLDLSDVEIKSLESVKREAESLSDALTKSILRWRNPTDRALLSDRFRMRRTVRPGDGASLSDAVIVSLARAESTSANRSKLFGSPRWLVVMQSPSTQYGDASFGEAEYGDVERYSSEDMEADA